MASKRKSSEPAQRDRAAREVEQTHQEASELHPPSGPVPPPLRRDRRSTQKANVAGIPPAALRDQGQSPAG
jgi:hypothetical protein